MHSKIRSVPSEAQSSMIHCSSRWKQKWQCFIEKKLQLLIGPLVTGVSHLMMNTSYHFTQKPQNVPPSKKSDKGLVHLVKYQVVLGEPQPRKGCRASISSPKTGKDVQAAKASILGKCTHPSVLRLHITPSPKNGLINNNYHP